MLKTGKKQLLPIAYCKYVHALPIYVHALLNKSYTISCKICPKKNRPKPASHIRTHPHTRTLPHTPPKRPQQPTHNHTYTHTPSPTPAHTYAHTYTPATPTHTHATTTSHSHTRIAQAQRRAAMHGAHLYIRSEPRTPNAQQGQAEARHTPCRASGGPSEKGSAHARPEHKQPRHEREPAEGGWSCGIRSGRGARGGAWIDIRLLGACHALFWLIYSFMLLLCST
jgi:hypothetical protein